MSEIHRIGLFIKEREIKNPISNTTLTKEVRNKEVIFHIKLGGYYWNGKPLDTVLKNVSMLH